jgi:hypothetical protein
MEFKDDTQPPSHAWYITLILITEGTGDWNQASEA